MLKFLKKSCGICKVTDVAMIQFENRSGVRMVLCYSCKKYAEKRSFKVVKHYPGKKIDRSVLQQYMG